MGYHSVSYCFWLNLVTIIHAVKCQILKAKDIVLIEIFLKLFYCSPENTSVHKWSVYRNNNSNYYGYEYKRILLKVLKLIANI